MLVKPMTDKMIRLLPFVRDYSPVGRVIRKPSKKDKSLMEYSFEQFKKTLPRPRRRVFVIYDETLTGGIVARGTEKIPWKEEGF